MRSGFFGKGVGARWAAGSGNIHREFPSNIRQKVLLEMIAY